jgi:hypothetical protein
VPLKNTFARNRYCHDAQDGQGLDAVFTYPYAKSVDQSFLGNKILGHVFVHGNGFRRLLIHMPPMR